MTTETIPTPTIEEDITAVTAAFLKGEPVPADVDARLEARAAEVRERIFREHSELDIAVPYIRQSRETGHWCQQRCNDGP